MIEKAPRLELGFTELTMLFGGSVLSGGLWILLQSYITSIWPTVLPHASQRIAISLAGASLVEATYGVAFLKIKKSWSTEELSLACDWRMKPKRDVAMIVLGAALGLCAVLTIHRVYPNGATYDSIGDSLSSFTLLLFFSVILQACLEEVFFRGFLFSAVEKWGVPLSSSVSMLLFVAAHRRHSW